MDVHFLDRIQRLGLVAITAVGSHMTYRYQCWPPNRTAAAPHRLLASSRGAPLGQTAAALCQIVPNSEQCRAMQSRHAPEHVISGRPPSPRGIHTFVVLTKWGTSRGEPQTASQVDQSVGGHLFLECLDCKRGLRCSLCPSPQDVFWAEDMERATTVFLGS